MITASCQRVMEGVGSGVAASLRAVDCTATATAQAAFGRLFGTDGALLPALTILLTLYIALLGYSLITGRSRLGTSTLTPRMITLGLVLTFSTSWIAYQSVVWNLAIGAPDQLASNLTGVSGSATQVFAEKLDIVMARLVEAGGNGIAPTTTFSPLGLMWLGGTLFLLGTVGVLVVAKIALSVLLGLGPVFVVLALFPGTRGLFAGWLKGVVMLAITPLFAVLGGSLMLELSVPLLSALAPTLPGEIDPQAAMAFFLLSAVHCALMILTLKVAGTMVAGWAVFGLAKNDHGEQDRDMATGRPAPVPAPSSAGAAVDQARAASVAPSRQIRMAPAAPLAANDSGGIRETHFVVSGTGSSGYTSRSQSMSRACGIGSRFRSPPLRKEKFK